MRHISGKLKLPTKGSGQSKMAASAGKALDAAKKINMGQRVINQVLKAGVDASLCSAVYNKDFDEALGDAVKVAAIATATGHVTDKIDASFANDDLNIAMHTISHVMTSAASSIVSNNPNGVLVGAVEGLISARLPEMFESKDARLEKSADDLPAEKLDAKTIRRQENSLHWIKQANLFGNPWSLETEVQPSINCSIVEKFQELENHQRITQQYGLIPTLRTSK